MAHFIVKIDPNRNLYAVWDPHGPETRKVIFIGTRESIEEWRIAQAVQAARAQARQEIAQADETGSSSPWGLCRWDRDYLPMGSLRGLPRSSLEEYIRLTAPGAAKSDLERARSLIRELYPLQEHNRR